MNEDKFQKLMAGEAEQVIPMGDECHITELMFESGRLFARYTIKSMPDEYFIMEVKNTTPNTFTCDPNKKCPANDELEGIKERLAEFKSMI